jgi:leucyl-tRNA synthetase
MIALNELDERESVSREHFESYLKLLAPFAPHAAEELWASLGNKESIHVSEWPRFDPKLIKDPDATIVVQINGRVRGSFESERGKGEEELKSLAKALPEAKKWLEDKKIKRIVVVPDKLVNIVTES